MSTAEALRLYCGPEQTPARSMAHQLDQLSKASAELVNSMRDLSPADLYQALHKLNRQIDYTCGEVAGAVIALEDLHKEQA
jgi:hypothetical protein